MLFISVNLEKQQVILKTEMLSKFEGFSQLYVKYPFSD